MTKHSRLANNQIIAAINLSRKKLLFCGEMPEKNYGRIKKRDTYYPSLKMRLTFKLNEDKTITI